MKFWALLALAATAAGQQVTHTPVELESGAPVLFEVALPDAVSLTGTWLKHQVVFSRSGHGEWILLAGIDVEQPPGTYALTLTERLIDGTTQTIETPVTIEAASYRTSEIRVPDAFTAPDAATRARIEADSAIKKQAFATSTPAALWNGSFARPVTSASTDSFGTRRTFNGTTASIHKGADFRAAAGTPVYAANDGVVLIARPMFYEGNFVLIDHGQQLMSMYLHFSRIDVRAGETVRKGQQLGLSGATGRVTGPHLHFAVRWQGDYLDPVKLLSLRLPSFRPSS